MPYVVSADKALALREPLRFPPPAALRGGHAPPGPPVYHAWRQVPAGLKTPFQWKRFGRKVPSPQPVPAAYMRDVPLFAEAQTKPYTPKPATVAFWEAADLLLRFLSPRRDYYSFKSKGDPDAKGWPRTYCHLSEQTFHDALSGKEVLALFHAGGLAYWFALDVDFHPGDRDRGRFLRRLAAVHDELAAEGEDWFAAGVNPANVSGCHFYVFTDEPLAFSLILDYAQAMKARLIEKHPDLFDDKLEVFPTVGGNPLRTPVCKGRCVILDRPLEGLPLREQAARLADWIRSPGGPMPKDEFIAWFAARTPEHRAKAVAPAPVPQPPVARVRPVSQEEVSRLEDEFLAGLDRDGGKYAGPRPTNYESMTFQEWFTWAPAEGCKSAEPKASQPPVKPLGRPAGAAAPRQEDEGRPRPGEPTSCCTKAVPVSVAPAEAKAAPRPGGRGPQVSYKGRFFQIQDDFWHNRLAEPEPDTIGSYLGPHARWALAYGYAHDAVAAFLRRQLPLLDYPGLSDRLDGDIEELVRSQAVAARRIAEGQSYQPDAARSDVIFAGVAAASRRLGIDPLDPSTFGRYRATPSAKLEVEDADLGEAQAEAVLAAIGWLNRDKEAVLAAARRVIGFVQGHPERELAAVFVPVLCGELGLQWTCPSDGDRRCKKAERFLAALVKAGVLRVEQDAVWRGRKKEGNKARRYALGPAMGVQAVVEAVAAVVEKEEGGMYLPIGDSSPCSLASQLEPLRREVRRLRRTLGPPRNAGKEDQHQPGRRAG